jgi:hypothetical protein
MNIDHPLVTDHADEPSPARTVAPAYLTIRKSAS